MARANLREREKAAAAARARMARRAKRTRFLKENKKRILYIFLAFLAVVFLAFFTPWGPDYFYNQIQMDKMENKSTVNARTIEKLYKLGRFYSYTLRKKQARDMYDELATLFYGFTLTEYAADPTAANEKRFQAQRAIAKGISSGPPFKVASSDVRYVGLAIAAMADLMMEEGPKDFPKRLYTNLYLQDFMVEHESAADPDVTTHVKRVADRLHGRR